MRWTRQAILALVAVFLLTAGPATGPSAAEVAAPAVGQADRVAPQTNEQIRDWYNQQIACIPVLNEQWLAAGLSAETRARRAHDIRHSARLKARDYMQNKAEVDLLRARDQEKYGNPDGPTFEYLVQQNLARALTGDAVYDQIIGSSRRTDTAYNARYDSGPAPCTTP